MRLFTLLAAPLLLLESKPVRIDELALRGSVEPASQQVTASLGSYIRTPFGRIPVSGHARVTYSCDGSFAGTVRYPGIIRLLAAAKGISLVSTVSGSLESADAWDCVTVRDSLVGHFRVKDTVLTGHLTYNTRTTMVEGVVQLHDDDHFEVVATSRGPGECWTVRITLR